MSANEQNLLEQKRNRKMRRVELDACGHTRELLFLLLYPTIRTL